MRIASKNILSFLFQLSCLGLTAQNLQLHCDFRHTVDPANTSKNYPTVYFEYFKSLDRSPDSALKNAHFRIVPGSFLIKTQADLQGAANNVGKFFFQVTQSLRFWKPKIYLSLQYGGGLGVTEPKQYSYYINNTFSAGAEVPFHWKGAWFSSDLYYRYTPYNRPSQDVLYTFYWWSGWFHYKIEWAGDFSIWTENRNHGDPLTQGTKGKRLFFFAEPQIWYNLNRTISLGTKINMYFHVNTTEDRFQVYPTAAFKCKF